MNRRSPHLYELVLRQCAGAAPKPWYPSSYISTDGVTREDIDGALDDLRLGGLVRLTDWVAGQGQGYVLTQEGSRVASSPAVLTRLREWKPVYAAQQEAPQTERAPNPRWTVLERGDAVRDALVHGGPPWMTRLLILVNIGVFLAGIFLAHRQNGDVSDFLSGRDTPTLKNTGAYHPNGLANGQWWLLLTTCFIHAGVLHIGCNMLALQSIGQWAERMYSWWGMLLLYLISGLGGSVLAVATRPDTITVGASGAICGIFAALASWAFLHRSHLPPEFLGPFFRSLRNSTIFIVAFSLLPNVSWQAHLGGAVVGLLTVGALSLVRFHRGLARWFGLLCLVGIVGALAAYVWHTQQFDQPPDVPALLRETDETWQGEVVPVLRLPPENRSEERIQQARAAIENSESRLTQAMVFLQTQRPRDEQTRRQYAQQLQVVTSRLIQMRVAEYLWLVYTDESEAVRTALKTYTLKIRPLLILRPSARGEELVENALLDIRDEHSRLSELAEGMTNGKSPVPFLPENIMQERVTLIDDLIKLYELARAALQDPKAWTADEQTQIEALETRLKSARVQLDQDVSELAGARRRSK
jgi:rhomboid protease GluP